MTFSHWFVLFCVVLNLYGTGVIWQTQRVSYPLFGMVGSKEYIPSDLAIAGATHACCLSGRIDGSPTLRLGR